MYYFLSHCYLYFIARYRPNLFFYLVQYLDSLKLRVYKEDKPIKITFSYDIFYGGNELRKQFRMRLAYRRRKKPVAKRDYDADSHQIAFNYHEMSVHRRKGILMQYFHTNYVHFFINLPTIHIITMIDIMDRYNGIIQVRY